MVISHCFLLAGCLLLAACGSIGDPLPPLANIPKPVTDLAAVQRGSRIIVQFTIPDRTTEDIAMKKPPGLDLRIGVASPPWNAEEWAAQARRIPGEPPYSIPSAAWVGKEVAIAVRILNGENGKASDWSNIANVPVVPTPETPTNVRWEGTAQGVRLMWTGAPGDFRVFRRAPSDPDFVPATDVAELAWLDPTTEFGKRYTYIVQRVVKLPSNREAESEPSAEVSITPADTFAPSAPAGLRAVAGPESIELSWDRNPDADVAGYRIYRAPPAGDFVKLADVSLVPSYSDRALERGKTYRYALSAVDQAGNESEKSAVAEIALP